MTDGERGGKRGKGRRIEKSTSIHLSILPRKRKKEEIYKRKDANQDQTKRIRLKLKPRTVP